MHVAFGRQAQGRHGQFVHFTRNAFGDLILIFRAAAEQRLLERFERSLTEDIAALLPAGATFSDEDAIDAIGRVWFRLLTRLRGESWKLSGQMIEHLRETKAKSLLNDRAI